MSTPDRKIRTEQEYQQFYAETSEVYLDSVHKVENFMLTRKTTEIIEVACDVTFSANKKPEPLTAIEVKGRIRFVLKPGEKPGRWKINQYLVAVE